MKNLLIITAVLAALTVSGFAQDQGPQLKDLKDKASYSIGMNIGMNFKKQNVELIAKLPELVRQFLELAGQPVDHVEVMLGLGIGRAESLGSGRWWVDLGDHFLHMFITFMPDLR